MVLKLSLMLQPRQVKTLRGKADLVQVYHCLMIHAFDVQQQLAAEAGQGLVDLEDFAVGQLRRVHSDTAQRRLDTEGHDYEICQVLSKWHYWDCLVDCAILNLRQQIRGKYSRQFLVLLLNQAFVTH